MSKKTTSARMLRPMTQEAIEKAARSDRDARPMTQADLMRMKRTPQAKVIRRALELIETGVVSASDFVDGEAFLDDLPALFQSMTAGNRAVKTLIRVGHSPSSA